MKTVVAAIGDIHGRLDLLEQLYDRIRAHKLIRRAHRRVLIHLGDYVDRGPDSKGVIERAMTGLSGFETISLLGNHEQLMLDYLDGASGDVWLRNGGREALASFDVNPDSDSREQAALKVGRTILDWLHALPRCYTEGGYFFVHAGVRPGIPLSDQSPEDLIWIRDRFTSSKEDFGLRIVHGHSPNDEPVVRHNRIGIDTGAVWTGRLTAALLDPEHADDDPVLLSATGPRLDELALPPALSRA